MFLYSTAPSFEGITVTEQLFVNNPKQFDVADAASFLTSMTGINFNNTYWPANNKFIIKKKKEVKLFPPQVQNDGNTDYASQVGNWSYRSSGYQKYPHEVQFPSTIQNTDSLASDP